MPIKEMARTIFGSDGTKEQNKLRGLLAAQKRAETVKNVGVGQWEVVTT